jgi:hypothetical protein
MHYVPLAIVLKSRIQLDTELLFNCMTDVMQVSIPSCVGTFAAAN